MPQQSPQIEIHPIKDKLPKDTPQSIDVLVRIKSPKREATQQVERPRVNLSLVIDRSGSMNGQKMPEAIAAACFCIDELKDDDHVSVVAFDSLVEVLSPAQRASEKQSIKERIKSLYPRGSTALHEGWVLGGLEVAKFQDPKAVNRVLLITDGQANVGIRNPMELSNQTQQLSERGISTSTIGIGRDFNEDLLIRMADKGSGNAWHVVEPEDMRKIFETELNGLVSQFGHSGRISITTPAGVRSVTCLNEFERDTDGGYKIPNLTSANDLDVVFRFEVDPIPASQSFGLGEFKMKYVDQQTNNPVEMSKTIEIAFVDAIEASETLINPLTREAITLIEVARERARMMERIDRGDFEGAEGYLRGSIDQMRSAASMHPSAYMDDELMSLEDELGDLMRDNPELARKKMAFRRRNRSFGKFGNL
jgi:Ca-activated chloride channel family protein